MRSYSLQGRWAPLRWAPLRWTALALAVALNLGGVRVGLGAPVTIDPAPSSEATYDDQGPLRLEDVKSGRSLSDDAIHPIRAEALKETALAYGARAGLYARAREINRLLDEEAGMLDRNFPFAPLILAHNVLPPVIQTGRDTVRQHHDAQLQFADAVYAIVRPARLAVAPPDWRTYLYVRAARPAPPDETLLPDRAKAVEVAYWERSIEDGWTRGVQQADQTLTVQLHRLERDLIGMALYRGRQDLARFRVNMTAARAVREWGLEITIRTIPTTPPTLDQLDLPTELRAHLAFEQGLVIVTGPTGSGKTTLLGAIIRALLEQPDSHRKIIAYESPIEYVYDAVPRARALIAQHEIGVHLQSFAAGVRNSLRRKPMVILVGESRDADTIDAMILAAQTGHLVYTTAHTNSVPETLTRLVEPFPVSEREGRLAGLLDSLRLIVTQRLVRTVDGRRAAAREYLHFTQAEKDRLAEVPFRQVARVARELVRQKGRPLTLDLHALHDAGRLSDTEFHHYREVGTQLDPLGGVAVTRCADPSDPADRGDPHDGR